MSEHSEGALCFWINEQSYLFGFTPTPSVRTFTFFWVFCTEKYFTVINKSPASFWLKEPANLEDEEKRRENINYLG